MKRNLIEILVCPVCKGQLELNIEAQDEKGVFAGSFHCAKCNEVFYINNGVPNFMPLGKILTSSFYKRWQKASRAHWDFHRKQYPKPTQSGNQRKRINQQMRQKALKSAIAMRADLVEKWGIPLLNLREMSILEIGGLKFPDSVFFGVEMQHKVALDPVPWIKDSDDCDVIQAMGEYIPIKPNTIDLCFSINTIDHTSDPLAVLREV